VQKDGDKLLITVPAADCQPIDTIVKLTLKTPALGIPPIPLRTLKVKATASSFYHQMAEYGPEMAFDENLSSRWATDEGTRQAWIATDLGKALTFDGVRLHEECGQRVQKFEFQRREGDEWKTIFSGTTIGSDFARKFAPVTAREVRLNIQDASEGPTFSEIELDGK
jgi:hypothetical protein